MGYTNTFKGQLDISKPLDDETAFEICRLSDDDYLVENKSNKNVPMSRCQWILPGSNKIIEWDKGDNFYYYMEWLEYIIINILAPKGYSVSGEILVIGEDNKSDVSKIIVLANSVTRQVYSQDQITDYYNDLRNEFKDMVGIIIKTTAARIRSINPWTPVSLSELFFRKFLSPKFLSDTIALVKEKNNSISLYNFSSDELEKGEIDLLVLADHMQSYKYISIVNIQYIIHYSSFLFKHIFGTDNNVYLIRERAMINGELYLLKDNSIIKQIIQMAPKDNFNYFVSSDYALLSFLLKRVFKATIIGVVSFIAVLSIIVALAGALRHSPAATLLVVGGILYGYYWFVIRGMFRSFYYFVATEIFERKNDRYKYV